MTRNARRSRRRDRHNDPFGRPNIVSGPPRDLSVAPRGRDRRGRGVNGLHHTRADARSLGAGSHFIAPVPQVTRNGPHLTRNGPHLTLRGSRVTLKYPAHTHLDPHFTRRLLRFTHADASRLAPVACTARTGSSLWPLLSNRHGPRFTTSCPLWATESPPLPRWPSRKRLATRALLPSTCANCENGLVEN